MIRSRWKRRFSSARGEVAGVEFVFGSLTGRSRRRWVQSASARNRRDEENAIAFLEGAGFPAEEADVFLVEIDIEELADLALVVANMAAESREAGSELVEGFRDGGGATVHSRRTLGEAAERSGNFDRNGHFEFSFTPY